MASIAPVEHQSLTEGMAVLEALLCDAYAAVAPAEAVLDALDKAGAKLERSMPDPRTWGTSDAARRSAAAAEALFAAG